LLKGKNVINPLWKREAVKKLHQFERVGRDIEKVLQRNFFMLTTRDEKV